MSEPTEVVDARHLPGMTAENGKHPVLPWRRKRELVMPGLVPGIHDFASRLIAIGIPNLSRRRFLWQHRFKMLVFPNGERNVATFSI
jgi:hypothetical protein